MFPRTPGRRLAGECLLAVGLGVLVVLVTTSVEDSSVFGWTEGIALGLGLALVATAGPLLGARIAVPAGVASLCLLSFFYKLGVPTWNPDERLYAVAGHAYISDGAFFVNLEHPPLAKYVLGLAQLIGGAGELLPVRLVAALASVAAVAFLFLLGRRAAGTSAGVIAAVLWACLSSPVIVSGDVVSPGAIGRFAILETVMLAFVAAALYAGWRWCDSADWRWAASAGVAVGLAGASKLPGLLILIPLLALAVYTQPLSRAGSQALVLVAAAAATIAVFYVPMGGDAFSVVERMVEFQREHATAGHLVTVGDRVYDHPPWWANAYFQWESMGALVTITLLVLVGAAFLVVNRTLAVYLSVAALTPFLYLSLVVPIALPHYFYLWLAPLVVLAAASLHALLGHARPAARRLGATAAVALAVAGALHLIDVLTLEQRDYALAAEMLRDREKERGIAVVVGYEWLLEAYLPDLAASDLAREPRPLPEQADAVVIDPVFFRRAQLPHSLQAFLRRGAPGFVRLRADRLKVYVRAEPAGGQDRGAPQAR